jgi:hypothetical protein
MQLVSAVFSRKIIENLNGLFRSWEKKLCLSQIVALKSILSGKVIKLFLLKTFHSEGGLIPEVIL